jgi:glyoxalase family protein
VADDAAIDFWADRLGADDVPVQRHEGGLRFRDPEGLDLELVVSSATDAPLVAQAPDVPAEHALLGFEGVRAFSSRPDMSARLLGDTLGFTPDGDARWRLRGDERSAGLMYDAAPAGRGIQGAGTVHHVAWASRDEDHEAWRARALDAGAHATPIIDRDYFQSVYFREPSGVLFELATRSPGFTVDEPAEHLGEALKLPKQHEHLRAALERTLTPLENPRAPATR